MLLHSSRGVCADEAEQVGIIEGACALLLGQPMYRLYSRQPAALAAVAAALLGSSGYQSPKAVQALSQAFITFAMGFIRPPMLDYCQVRTWRLSLLAFAMQILQCKRHSAQSSWAFWAANTTELKTGAGALPCLHNLKPPMHRSLRCWRCL